MKKLRAAVAQAVEDALLDKPIETDVVDAFRAGVRDLSEGPIVCLDIDEQLRLFVPGDLVDPLDPLVPLPLHQPDPDGRMRLAARPRPPRRPEVLPQRWLVVNVRWDTDMSYLWIELVSLGGHVRGWLRDPVRRVKIAPVL